MILDYVLIKSILLYAQQREKIRDEDEGLYNKVGTFFRELSNESYMGSLYYVFLNVRKLVMCLTLYPLIEIPSAFLGIQMAFSIIFCTYFIYCRVFEGTLRSVLYILAEIAIFLTFLITLLMYEIPDARDYLGKLVITVNVGYMLIVTFIKLISALYTCIKKKKMNRQETKVIPISIIPCCT